MGPTMIHTKNKKNHLAEAAKTTTTTNNGAQQVKEESSCKDSSNNNNNNNDTQQAQQESPCKGGQDATLGTAPTCATSLHAYHVYVIHPSKMHLSICP